MSKNTDLGNLVNGLFVSSTRNVGIGTTTPRAKLDINGALYSNDVWIADNYALLFGDLNAGASAAYIAGLGATGATSYLSFSTNGTQRVRINPAGNVGIGTSTPVGAATDDLVTQIYNSAGGGSASRAMIRLTNSFTGSTWGNGSWISIDSSQDLYIANSEPQNLFLQTSGSTRMTITGGGNVGINTTSPGGLLQINNTSTKYIVYTSSGNIEVYQPEATASGTQVRLGSAYNLPGVYSNGQLNLNSDSGNAIAFHTNGNSEKMRITSVGKVLIGTTTVLDTLTVNGGVRTIGTGSGNFFDDRSSSNFFGWYATSGQPFFFNGAVGNIVSINPSNGAYSALSNIDKKKDFEQSNIGLNEVMQLKPTLYRFKTDDDSSPKDLGFIAQEVKDLIPQAYTENGEGDNKFIGLNQMPLIAALTKAIQELSSEINILKNK